MPLLIYAIKSAEAKHIELMKMLPGKYFK